MTPTPTSPPAGLAELIGRISAAEQVPAVALVIDTVTPDGSRAPDGSAATWRRDCQALACVTVHPAFLGEDQAVMAGVLAHEIAHHRADVADVETAGDRLVWASVALAAGVLAAVVAGIGLGPSLVQAGTTVAAWAAYRLWRLRYARREELGADAYAVLLLDAVGLPGRDCTRAALERVAEDEGRLDRWLWMFHTHPTSARRLAALD